MLSTANISDIWPFCKSMTSNPSPCLPNITFVCLPANLEWLLQEMEKLLTIFLEKFIHKPLTINYASNSRKV